MKKVFFFLLAFVIKSTIAQDSHIVEQLTSLKTLGKLSIEIKDNHTGAGINSKIVITDNKLYFKETKTDSVGKLNKALPAGNYQAYIISDGYKIQIADFTIIKRQFKIY